VYKASWRGAGVAVKYIVCPTDDSDSLGRAIREVSAGLVGAVCAGHISRLLS